MKPAAFSSNADSQLVSRHSLTVLPVLDASALASSPLVGQSQRLAGTRSSIGFGASQLSVAMGLSAEEMVAKAEEERKQNKRLEKYMLVHVHCCMFTAACSLLHVHCYMFTATCSLLHVHCNMFTARRTHALSVIVITQCD